MRKAESRAVIFLYKFIPGIADSSFGVGVAQMAGLPEKVLLRAEQKSAELKLPKV